MQAPTRDKDRLPWGDSRSTPRFMSVLERKPQEQAPTPHKVLGPGTDGRGILSSADMDLGVLLESPQGSQSSSRVGACPCTFLPSCCSCVTFPFAWIKGSGAFPRGFPTRLSHEAFPRGFPTWLSHVPPWCESILGLKVEAVQGKQVSLEWTETSGGLWEWWHDPGVPLAFPVESACS